MAASAIPVMIESVMDREVIRAIPTVVLKIRVSSGKFLASVARAMVESEMNRDVTYAIPTTAMDRDVTRAIPTEERVSGRLLESAMDREVIHAIPVSYTHLTLPTNREV